MIKALGVRVLGLRIFHGAGFTLGSCCITCVLVDFLTFGAE